MEGGGDCSGFFIFFFLGNGTEPYLYLDMRSGEGKEG